VSVTAALPKPPALSRTVTVAVRGPLSAVEVGQASETGPVLVVVVLVIVEPCKVSV